MSKIFAGGYLLTKFINPNYRGLVGWDLSGEEQGDVLVGIANNTVLFKSGCHQQMMSRDFDIKDDLTIKQFTPSDIPVGELCWVSNGEDNWELRANSDGESALINYKIEGVLKSYGTNSKSYKYIVPYLIAETAEDAEIFKDWAIV